MTTTLNLEACFGRARRAQEKTLLVRREGTRTWNRALTWRERHGKNNNMNEIEIARALVAITPPHLEELGAVVGRVRLYTPEKREYANLDGEAFSLFSIPLDETGLNDAYHYLRMTGTPQPS